MEEDVISYKEGLYLATLGGAKALGIDVSSAPGLLPCCVCAVTCLTDFLHIRNMLFDAQLPTHHIRIILL